jgi:hypothetical protein
MRMNKALIIAIFRVLGLWQFKPAIQVPTPKIFEDKAERIAGHSFIRATNL